MAPMNGMSGTCPECEAELAPGARFCPRCGGFAGIMAAGPVPGGQPTMNQQAMPQPPQWLGGPGTVAAPAPNGGVRVPRAALPAALPAAAPRIPPADAMADWSAPPTVGRQPAFPPSPPPPFQPPQQFSPFEQPQQAPPPFSPFEQPSPPTRVEPARYQDGPPTGGYPTAGYAPGGYPQEGYPQDGFAPGGYQPTGYAPGGYPQSGFPPDGFAPTEYTPGARPPDGYPPTEYTPGGRQQNDYPATEYAPAGNQQDGFAPTEFTPRGRPAGYLPGPAGGPGEFEPSPPYPDRSPDGPTAPRQPPRRHDRDRRSVPLALWLVLIVLLLGGAGAAFKLLHHSPGKAGTASGAAAGAAASGSASRNAAPSGTASKAAASGTASAGTEQQAAAGVAALLSQSATDRTATNAAANDTASCGPDLKSDPAVFGNAVTSRQALLTKLAAVPGRATLPAALITELTGAWQASIAADQAYVKWANDELAKTCVPNDTADPGFQATVTPNQQATTDKMQFAAAWQPVAAKYGLTTYQPGQL